MVLKIEKLGIFSCDTIVLKCKRYL